MPINVARDIMDQLRSKGRVARGYLGISLGEITPEYQEAWSLKNDKGALVEEVKPGLPADQAGIQRGDVVIAVDGKEVQSRNEVVHLISSKKPGAVVKLTLLRNGKELTINAKLADRAQNLPQQYAEKEGEGGEGEEGAEPNERKLGIEVEDLSPQVYQQLHLPKDVTGVVVTDVSKVSSAYEKGIEEGDVITEVNRIPIKGLADFRREIRKAKEGGLVVFYVITPSSRTGGEPLARYVTVRVEKAGGEQ